MNTNLKTSGNPQGKLQGPAALKNLTGANIRLFREKRGWTQQRLAESLQRLGIPITRDVIANIETQRCPVTDWQVVFFARILGVSYSSLFPDKNTLKNLAPPDVDLKQHPKSKQNVKHLRGDPRFEVPSNQRSICEVMCKSVKIIFHPE